MRAYVAERMNPCYGEGEGREGVLFTRDSSRIFEQVPPRAQHRLTSAISYTDPCRLTWKIDDDGGSESKMLSANIDPTSCRGREGDCRSYCQTILSDIQSKTSDMKSVANSSNSVVTDSNLDISLPERASVVLIITRHDRNDTSEKDPDSRK